MTQLLALDGAAAPEGRAPISYGAAQLGAGAKMVESGDISATAKAKYLVRFGVKYDVSSGTNPATAEVELQVAYDMCGQAVGTFDEQLMVTSDTKVFYALTPWLPSDAWQADWDPTNNPERGAGELNTGNSRRPRPGRCGCSSGS